MLSWIRVIILLLKRNMLDLSAENAKAGWR